MTAELRAMHEEKAQNRAERAKKNGRDDDKAAQADPSPKEPRASTTDAQARVMKIADGGFRPAYNVQFTADTKSGAVASVAVDNVGSDMGRLEPTSTALETTYGRRPSEHLADGRYATLDDITTLARAGVTPPTCPYRRLGIRHVTATRACPMIHPKWPRGGNGWRMTRPRKSTGNGPRR